MKKISKFLCGIMLAVLMVAGVNFFAPNTNTTASAAAVNVTFNATGGKINGSTDNYQLTTGDDGKLDVALIPTPTHEDFVFIGWFEVAGTEPVDFSTKVFESITTLSARWATKTNTYTISTYENDSKLSVIGQTNEDDLNYELIDEITSLQDAIDAIKSDIYNPTTVSINFNNITLIEEETISLDFNNIALSGSITSTSDLPVLSLTPSANNSTYHFLNITISSNADVIVDLSNTDNSANLILENAHLNTSVSNSYAINFTTNASHSIKLLETNSHTSTFLFEYDPSLTIDLSTMLKNDVANPIYASIDYTYDNVCLLTNFNNSNHSKFIFKENDTFYHINQFIMNKEYWVYSILNIELIANGGEYADGYTVPNYNYTTAEQIDFPTSTNISKNHSTFVGWFGKLEFSDEQKTHYGLSSNVYYYDTVALARFKANGFDTSTIEECFKTSTDTFDNLTAFTGYIYDVTKTNTNNYYFDLALQLGTDMQFVALWEDILYSISFNSNGGSAVSTISEPYGTTITKPTDPTKEGYSFGGWFKDTTLMLPYTFSTMTDTSITLYAKWNINTYTITFIHEGTPAGSQTAQFGTEIEFPTNAQIFKKGHKLDGWTLTENSSELYAGTTIPASDITLHAVWSLEEYYIYFDVNPKRDTKLQSSAISTIAKLYGETVEKPANPTAEGYEFDGWYTSSDYQYAFVFSTMPDYNSMAFAKWVIKQYKITFVTNTAPSTIEETYNYGETVAFPTQPTKKGYSFEGWYQDQDCTTAYTFGTMPAENISVYAKWEEKEVIMIEHPAKSTVIDTRQGYVVDSDISGFYVEYLVNGEWTHLLPTEIGKYDIRIFRAEDDNYAEYLMVVEDGFEIINKTLNLTWLIVLLIVLIIAEIVVIVIVKKMQKIKKTDTITLAIALPFGIVTTNQFVLLLVFGSLALFGFILLVYELVKLHRIVPLDEKKHSIYDTRNTIESMKDNSEDAAIASKVDELLKNEGLADLEVEEDSQAIESDDENDTPKFN